MHSNSRVQSLGEEAFADLTGMRRAFHASCEGIALRIKKDKERN
jgi:hypothetical protein